VGSLQYEGARIGVIFGVLRTLFDAIDFFNPRYTILAFENPEVSLRRRVYPEYKAHRRDKERTEEEKAEDLEFFRQVDDLRDRFLPAAGFRNIWSYPGYEGDDIIAAYSRKIGLEDDGVIATSDKDLYQCISSNVVWWNPYTKETMTASRFREIWGIFSYQWADVKAWAGCSTDGIPGIPGVGEKTAAKWICGKLQSSSKTYQKISEGVEIYNRNLPLVTLPYPGIVLAEAVPDEVTEDSRRRVLQILGAKPKRVDSSPGGFDLSGSDSV
jgi:5'-3' exonuclease